MRTTLTLALTLLLLETSEGKPHMNIGGLHPDKLRVLSPDGKYELWNEDEIFVINPRGVDGTFFSDAIPELDASVSHNALYATWSPNSRMVAICVQTSKFVEDTFVMIEHGQYKWRYMRLPYNDPDAWVIPLRWLDSNRLVIEISGPRETKSEPNPDFYVCTMTVEYDRKKDRFFKKSESKPQFPDRNDKSDSRAGFKAAEVIAAKASARAKRAAHVIYIAQVVQLDAARSIWNKGARRRALVNPQAREELAAALRLPTQARWRERQTGFTDGTNVR